MGPKVVPLLLVVASVQSLYDGREGKAIDFNNRPSLRQQFSLSDLTPEDNEVVYTQFTVKGLDVLDDLPPVNINHINSIHNNVKSVSNKNDVNKKTNQKQPAIPTPRFPSRPQPSPAVPSFPRQQDRNNVYNNFPTFPGVFNPWRNFYNFANFQPQVTTDRPRIVTTSKPRIIEEERNKNRRRRPTTTPLTTPRPTTTTTRRTTTTTQRTTTTRRTTSTTTVRYQQDEYDYQYYDFNTNTVNREDYHQEDDRDYYDDDHDYVYGNEIFENSDYAEEEPVYEDNSVNTLTGCPGTLRDCLSACSPVVSINPAAYKICVNECLDRC